MKKKSTNDEELQEIQVDAKKSDISESILSMESESDYDRVSLYYSWSVLGGTVSSKNYL